MSLQVGYHRNTALANSAPLFHVGGLSSSLAVMAAGGSLALNATWKPDVFLDRLHKGEVNALLAVPTMLKDLVDIINRKEVLNLLLLDRRMPLAHISIQKTRQGI